MQPPLFYFVLSDAAAFRVVSLTDGFDSGMIIARGDAK
jgi:hypothetical protein